MRIGKWKGKIKKISEGGKEVKDKKVGKNGDRRNESVWGKN